MAVLDDGPAGDDSFYGNRAPKEPMLESVAALMRKMAAAVRKNKVFFGYAENFVYAPAIQKDGRSCVRRILSHLAPA